ncbi:MAG: DUF1501 domain-containing protein [Saprospiraceae bacterium]|nr:DUF1501 domain-containing protein [Saprospiraceae bacterium]
MKRRQFLQTGSLVSLPIIIGGLEVSAISRSSLFNLINNDNDRVLVLVQLNGGNDGLNMVIPIDQYSGLSQVRSNLLLPENKVLKMVDKTGLHPSMSGLHRMYQDGKMAVIQSVGYPNQNRSHFRSTDIWTTASASDEYLTSGWIGRYLDLKYPGYPTGYPNSDCPDPFAITLGAVVSETCQGPVTNFSYSLVNQASVRLVEETVSAPVDGSCYSTELDYIRTTIKQSNAYAGTVLNAFDNGNNIAEYPENNRLADQLRIVANLISGGLGTKIYVVSLGGFDTHANQVLIGDTENGEHATLLQMVSEAVSAFMKDCEALGVEERVMGMTFSEFGRQIRANNSFGTDHGTAAPLLVFGSCTNQGVYGDNPEITAEVAPQEGVPMQYDFRSVYGSLLVDWLGASETEVRNLLYEDFQKISFVKDCDISSSTNDSSKDEIYIKVAPNPCQAYTYVNFTSEGQHFYVSLFNGLGSELQILLNKKLSGGSHELTVDMQSFPSGNYFIRFAYGSKVKTIRFVKI